MFRNDYSNIADKRILDALIKYSNEENIGYGEDYHSLNAEKLILKKFGLKDGKVFFLNGGTQTNLTIISFLLKPYEAVISCETGHINVHETGAVEATGHKIITIHSDDGKLHANDIEEMIDKFSDEHMVKPKMVYISDTTETGSLYNKEELLSLRKTCDKHNLYLFLDGARLAVALTNPFNDVACELISEVCDVFYIGGTKNGMLAGEAVVFKEPLLACDFRRQMKNKGAMNAKSFVLGIMFERAFEDDLYFELGKHTNEMSSLIKKNLLNVEFVGEANTNQLFIKVSNKEGETLAEKFGCEIWEKNNEFSIIRIVTSHSTTEEEVLKLCSFINNYEN